MDLSIAIPFYNEESNVAGVLEDLTRSLSATGIDFEIIAIDNGSKDRTGTLIDTSALKNTRIKKVHVPVNKGYGFGIRQGLAACRGDYIGYLWGDQQIRCDIIPVLLENMKTQHWRIAKIVRQNRSESFIRRAQSRVYNTGMDLLFSIESDDINGCPKVMDRAAFESLDLRSDDWFIDAEILIKCRRNNYKVGEVPVTSEARKGGKSNVGWTTCVEFAKNIVRYRIR